jgi:hypothetical protein
MKATKITVGLTVVLACFLSTSLLAQTIPGRAEVRAIRGQAVYSTESQAAVPLKVGTVLPPGSTIKTALASSVDLFLGASAGVLRVTENTTLALDRLAVTETRADTVVEVQLNLPEGTILGNVDKLSAASKYEIKLPNGVAGIRGTRYRISSTAFIVLLNGTLIFVHAPPGGPLTPHTLNAPPACYFSPLQGVMPAPADLVSEVQNQSSDRPIRDTPVAQGTQPNNRPLDTAIDIPGEAPVDSSIPNTSVGLVSDEPKEGYVGVTVDGENVFYINEELAEDLGLAIGDDPDDDLSPVDP